MFLGIVKILAGVGWRQTLPLMDCHHNAASLKIGEEAVLTFYI